MIATERTSSQIKIRSASTWGTGTTTAISNTSIEPEIKNNEIHWVSDEYSLDTENRYKSQQILDVDIKPIQNKQE